MDKDRIIEYLSVINEVGVDYSAARKIGLTDDEADRIGMAVIAATIDLIENMEDQLNIMDNDIDSLSDELDRLYDEKLNMQEEAINEYYY